MQSGGPFFVIPARKGAVPGLTPTQAGEILEEDERILSLSVFDALDYTGACAKLNMPFSKLCGLPDFRVILTLRTSFLGLHQSAPSTDAGIAGDHERGRSAVSLMKWKETIAAIKPTAAVQLSESIPLSEPASKKRRIATTRVMGWAKKCDACDGEHATSDANCEWIPPMLTTQATRGFLDVFSRNENTRELANGLACLKLSGTAPSFLYAYSVPSMLAAMLAGVQFIESPLPWELADKGVAMVFALPSEKEHFGAAGAMTAEIDLNDDMYTLDIGPLCAGCNCYTCKRHNRAYIHHLLSVQEMNSTILLAIHNMQRIVCMFREARKLNGDKKALSSFVETLITQF